MAGDAESVLATSRCRGISRQQPNATTDLPPHPTTLPFPATLLAPQGTLCDALESVTVLCVITPHRHPSQYLHLHTHLDTHTHTHLPLPECTTHLTMNDWSHKNDHQSAQAGRHTLSPAQHLSCPFLQAEVLPAPSQPVAARAAVAGLQAAQPALCACMQHGRHDGGRHVPCDCPQDVVIHHAAASQHTRQVGGLLA